MDRVVTDGIEMTWDAHARLAFIRFERETRAAGKDAVLLIEALTRWIGTDREPFGLLGDGGKLAGTDPAYRSAWNAFFRQHREESCIAFFNMSPIIRIAAEMFGRGTGLRLRAFAREEQARGWLRDNGIGA